jgi:hypothetical protein
VPHALDFLEGAKPVVAVSIMGRPAATARIAALQSVRDRIAIRSVE